jgi:hypothetical protein
MNRLLLLAPAFAGLFLFQALPSVTLALQHQEHLEQGRSVLLAVETRDPRDLLRGEYSRLAFEIGRLRAAPVEDTGLTEGCDFSRQPTCRPKAGKRIYVRVAPDAAGIHRLVDVRSERPARGELFLAGTLANATLSRAASGGTGPGCAAEFCLDGQVNYGIETWYGPQGRPAKLDAVRRGDVLVEARVTETGQAVLDAVRVEGSVFARTARLW